MNKFILNNIFKSQIISIISRYFFVIIIGLVCIPFDLLFANILSIIFSSDNLIPNKIPVDFLWFGSFVLNNFEIYFSIFLLGSFPVLIRAFQAFKTLEISEKIANKLFQNIYINMIYSEKFILEEIGENNALGIISTHLNAFMNLFITPIIQAFSALLIALCFFSLSVIVHPKAAILIISSSGIAILIFSLITKKYRKKITNKLGFLRTIQIGIISSGISQYRTLHYAKTDNALTEKSFKIDSQLRKSIKIAFFLSQSIKFFIEISLPIAFIYIAIELINNGKDKTLLIALILILKSLPFIQQTISCISTAQLNQKSYSQVRELIKNPTCKKNKPHKLLMKNYDEILFPKFSIRGFKRPFDPFALKVNSLNLLVGKSGTGKSTYLKSLTGQIDNNQDLQLTIKKKNQSFSKIDLQKLQTQIFYQNQYYSLLPIKIIDNIKILNQNAKIQNIKYLMKLFGIYQTKNLSNNKLLNLDISKYPNLLSGGEVQRICLVRAFISNYQIIFLDEPTSSLDIISTKIVIEALKKMAKNKTIFIASHDRDFLKVTTNIYKII